MAIGRMYTVDFGILAVALAGPTPIGCWTCTATGTLDVQAIRVACLGASTFPANASLQFTLARATGSQAGGHSVTPNPHNSTDIAATTTFLNCGLTAAGSTYTAITGLTQTVTLWQQEIPFTAGADWAEWVTPGAEWRFPASGVGAVYLTQSSAGTATTFGLELVCAE